jgi:membrane protein implicated in regulation of membrane protease activity
MAGMGSLSPEVLRIVVVCLAVLVWLIGRRSSARFLRDRDCENWKPVRIASLVNDTAFGIALILFAFSDVVGYTVVFSMFGVSFITVTVYGLVRPIKPRYDRPPDAP